MNSGEEIYRQRAIEWPPTRCFSTTPPMAEFVRRPLPVRAVQWTRGNGPAVTELLRTVKPHWLARDNPHGGWQSVVDQHYQTFGHVRGVWIGDWLVVTPEAGIAWMSPSRFEELYVRLNDGQVSPQ